jgi:lipopolysaccharide/colanic/teichoic acid biosynthesis glycosyltransferase
MFDRSLSLILLLIFCPVLLVIAIAILFDNGPPVFYLQERVGLKGRPFRIIKFRTMRPGSDQDLKLTVGDRDPRITRTGYFLRKYKLDELPQLINVLTGDMSFVGPRPEVPEYVRLYTEDQKIVLTVRPGITDNASIEYIDENELLSRSEDAEKEYIENVMPSKLAINIDYLGRSGFFSDLGVLFRTLLTVLKR